jgi:hypothetical protein
MRISSALRSWPAILSIAACTALVLALVAAVRNAPAATAPSAGTLVVSVSSTSSAKGAVALRKAGIKVTAAKPAKTTKTTWKLPVHGTPAIDATSVALDGELKFGAGKKQVSFIGLRLSLGSKPTITGALGKKKYTIVTLAKAPVRDAAARTISFSGTSVSLSPVGAKAIRTGLKLKKLGSGVVGTVTLTARAAAPVTPTDTTTKPTTTTPTITVVPTPVPTTPTTTTPTTTTPTTPDPDPPVDPFAAECPVVPLVSQAPPSDVQLLDPPLTGTAATASSFAWGFKQSFREYVASIGSLQGLSGATYAADAFSFPFANATTTYPDAPARAVVHQSGTALFCGLQHGFSVALTDPTVVIDGADSKLIADVNGNDTGAITGPNRMVVATLDATGITPSYNVGTGTVTWTGIPASLTAQAAPYFGGFYTAGTALDPITVAVTLP